MSGIPRPCLGCQQLTTNGSRCADCQALQDRQREARRGNRDHYKGDYKKRAKEIRDNATHCWICGGGYIPTDPFQADHLHPGEPDSPLAAAHRSCNARRKNLSIEETIAMGRAQSGEWEKKF